MPRCHPSLLLPAILVAALLPVTSLHAEAPACNAATAGAVTCMAGRMCACDLQRSGRMTGAREGWRWDCGILRPACGGGPDTPAMTGDYPQNLPSSLSLERDTLIVRPRPRPDPDRPGHGRPPWR